jgi:hypothetical protein
LLNMWGTERFRTIEISAPMLISGEVIWYPVPVFSVGTGLQFIKAKVASTGFNFPPDGDATTLGAMLSFSGRAALSSRFEIEPRITVVPAQLSFPLAGSPVKWHGFFVEPVRLRVNL